MLLVRDADHCICRFTALQPAQPWDPQAEQYEQVFAKRADYLRAEAARLTGRGYSVR